MFLNYIRFNLTSERYLKMSLIEKLYKKQATETKMISTSVKIPQVMDEVISDLAVFFDSTKQEVILDLLSDAIESYKAEEKKLFEQEEDQGKKSSENETVPSVPKYFLLNTCKRYSIDDHDFMIDNGYAAAFEIGYKEQINRIKKGDIVFLYANGKGISGYGRASGIVLKTDHNGDPEECYYQELENYVALDKPLKAKEIRELCTRTPVFLRTLSPINKEDGQIIYNELSK